MASYQLLKPTKTDKPRIKLISEFRYDESGKRLRKTKTVTLKQWNGDILRKIHVVRQPSRNGLVVTRLIIIMKRR
ncbi:hypothetical protein ACQKMD_12355 [Viridibacillus sp. NPDC096237]|uniref:hypothetical protein n=1 Tax=Viridibacillus sp. NPDC096237 TaxID=3390721 RepID=UPI003D04BED4